MPATPWFIIKPSVIIDLNAPHAQEVLDALQRIYESNLPIASKIEQWVNDQGHITLEYQAGALDSWGALGHINYDIDALNELTYIDKNGNSHIPSIDFFLLHELGHALLGKQDSTDGSPFIDAADSNDAWANAQYASYNNTPQRASYSGMGDLSQVAANVSWTNGQQISSAIYDKGVLEGVDYSNLDLSSYSSAFSFLILGNSSWNNKYKGGMGNDYIYGDSESSLDFGSLSPKDTLDGNGGNDLLVGGYGDDTLIGGPGDDVLWGGRMGSETGGGTDLADYSSGSAPNSMPITINYDGTGGTPVVTVNDGTGGTDTLHSIEVIKGTTHEDVLKFKGKIPTGYNLTIDANGGQPGGVKDVVNAAGSTDLAGMKVIIAPGSGAGFITSRSGTGGTITLKNFHTDITGSDFSDIITDESNDEHSIDGGAGDDTITVGGPNATVDGGGGNDVIHLKSAAATINFGAGGGSDVVEFDNGDGDYELALKDLVPSDIELIAGGRDVYNGGTSDPDDPEGYWYQFITVRVKSTGDQITFLENGRNIGPDGNGSAIAYNKGLYDNPLWNPGAAQTNEGKLDRISFADGTVIDQDVLWEILGVTDSSHDIDVIHDTWSYRSDFATGKDPDSYRDYVNTTYLQADPIAPPPPAPDQALPGTPGDDNIKPGSGNDTVTGGAGDDTISESPGDDTYNWNTGDGSDEIAGSSGNDGFNTLRLGAGVTQSDLRYAVAEDGAGLTISFAGQPGSVTLGDELVGDGLGTDRILFADGSIMTRAQILAAAGADIVAAQTVVNGTSGADFLPAPRGNFILNAGAGNDYISLSGSGSGTFKFASGDGHDTLADNGFGYSRNDTLWLTDANPADVALSRTGDQLVVTISSTGASVTVNAQFAGEEDGETHGLGTILFADGTTWTRAHIRDVASGTLNDISPTAQPSTISIAEDGAIVRGNLIATDPDAGDVLKFKLDGVVDGLVLAPDGSWSFNPGAASYQHLANGETLVLNAAYHVTDRAGATSSSTLTINLTGTNDIPTVVTGLVDQNVSQGASFAFDLPVGTFADVDGDSLILSATLADGSPLPEWISFNDGHFTGITPMGEPGSLAIQVVASDGSFWTASQFALSIGPDLDGPDVITGTEDADTRHGGNGDDQISGLGGSDSLFGDDGNDTLNGGDGNDTLNGGTGIDTLDGGNGNDTYVFAPGDGQDVISDTRGSGITNTVLFGSGIAPSDISVYTANSGSDIVLGRLDSTDTVTISAMNSDTTKGIDEVRFADGTVWSYADIMARRFTAGNDTITGISGNDTLYGGAGNDTIKGLAGNDVLDGGTGNDTLSGGDGDDIYRFASGDGQDRISEHDSSGTGSGGVDTIQLGAGILPTNVTVSQANNGNDLVLSFAGSSDTITISGAVSQTQFRIEHVAFADGTNWSYADLMAKATTPTSADDIFYGDEGNQTLQGGAGNDKLYGRAGDDILVGGVGNDKLDGGTGSDTFVFAQGDGNDTIADSRVSGFINSIQLGAGITAQNTFITTSANGLDIVVGFVDSSDTITISYMNLSGVTNGIDQIQFADGSSWSYADIMARRTAFTAGDDTITGTSGNETLYGGDGNDTLLGLAGNDSLAGGAGNDTLTGGAGNDVLNGGSGTDTAIFAGLQNDYQLTTSGGGLSIADLQPTVSGDDGTDQLIGVETAQFSDQSMSLAAPVILDLDGNGVSLVDRTQSTTSFDWNGDGVADHTGWTGQGDAFLALDRNHDGRIDSAAELSFANDKPGAKSDLDGLSAFDSNGDGKLSADDGAFGDFRIWQDTNANGVSDAGEVKSLADAGIAAIDLGGSAVNQSWSWDANVTINTGTFERADGSVGQLADAALNYEPSVQQPAAGIAADPGQPGHWHLPIDWATSFGPPWLRMKMAALRDLAPTSGDLDHVRAASAFSEQLAAFVPESAADWTGRNQAERADDTWFAGHRRSDGSLSQTGASVF